MEQEISITWTNPSLEDLQAIFDFYAAHSNPLADRIVSRLEGYHKIIYRITDPQHVRVVTVFDVRQGPNRLIERFE